MCVACVLYILFASKKRFFTVSVLKYLVTGIVLWLKNSFFSVTAVIFVIGTRMKAAALWLVPFLHAFLYSEFLSSFIV